jgi:hypothetical protein
MEHTNTLCGQNAENLYIETGGTLDIKGLICEILGFYESKYDDY